MNTYTQSTMNTDYNALGFVAINGSFITWDELEAEIESAEFDDSDDWAEPVERDDDPNRKEYGWAQYLDEPAQNPARELSRYSWELDTTDDIPF